MAKIDISSVLSRLESSGRSPAALSGKAIAALAWASQAPGDYLQLLERFGGGTLSARNWTLPAVSERGALEEAFALGDPPRHLVPFAEQDGTWFMAFDLRASPPLIVEWDHEQAKAAQIGETFAEWLSARLDEESDDAVKRAEVEREQRHCALEHVPFPDTSFGRSVVAKGSDPKLIEVLLDLHLQYTFQPRVIENRGLFFAGLLHFAEGTVGCWRCGKLNGETRGRCERCGEALLLGTWSQVADLPRHDTAWQECFGKWAADYVNLRAPVPVLIKTPTMPRGVPFWARLPRFGGGRDPRVAGYSTVTSS